MYPILFNIGPVTIYTVSVLHALGYYAGIYWIVKHSSEYKIDKEKLYDFFLIIILFSIIGARVFSILFDGSLNYYLQHPSAMLMLWNGGFTFYGGFIFAVLAGLFYLKKHNLDLWAIADLAAPALALGLAVGRLGCYASGDSFGKQTNLPWAVIYSDPHSIAPLGIPLHPTQIYSVITNLFIFIFLLYLKKRQKFKGQIAFVFILLYGITRSFVEIFRNDPRGVYLSGLISTSQIISIVIVFVTLIFYLLLKRKRKILLL